MGFHIIFMINCMLLVLFISKDSDLTIISHAEKNARRQLLVHIFIQQRFVQDKVCNKYIISACGIYSFFFYLTGHQLKSHMTWHKHWLREWRLNACILQFDILIDDGKWAMCILDNTFVVLWWNKEREKEWDKCYKWCIVLVNAVKWEWQ